jgi:hypothetical protein
MHVLHSAVCTRRHTRFVSATRVCATRMRGVSASRRRFGFVMGRSVSTSLLTTRTKLTCRGPGSSMKNLTVHTLGASFRCQLRSKTSGTFTASRPSAGQRRKKLRTRTCRESGFRVIALSSSRAGESNNATTAFPRVELRWVNEDQILNLFAASQRRADSAVPVVL